jgi:hypothetical protein
MKASKIHQIAIECCPHGRQADIAYRAARRAVLRNKIDEDDTTVLMLIVGSLLEASSDTELAFKYLNSQDELTNNRPTWWRKEKPND